MPSGAALGRVPGPGCGPGPILAGVVGRHKREAGNARGGAAGPRNGRVALPRL
ncbi:hypothetical protein GCM10007079_37960 [Nocardiopsis terrae]|nr:hypothetical protein GCM10007079_37960 [Nocardiopsis terrae]